jgi:hypothetical protein
MTNKEKLDKIEKFIDENNLSFEEGRRNSDSTILSGFALYVGLKTLPTLKLAVENRCDDREWGWEEELERVFEYAKDNNYELYWASEDAKDRYTF